MRSFQRAPGRPFPVRWCLAVAALGVLCLAAPFPVAAQPQDVSTPPEDQSGCHGTDPCQVDNGRYYVRAPEDWDGTRRLPVIVWFHGWQDTGLRQIGDTGAVADWTGTGWLFVAADGAEKTWAHQGSPSQARDDIAYVRRVIEDVMDRYPVDESRILAAGFSQGGSMVWDVACRLGTPFSHYAPVAGAFWEPAPTDCPAGPAAIRHVHGTADTVVPLQGRPIGDRWHQADVFDGLTLWRQTNGCAAAQTRNWRADDVLDCRAWQDCTSGKSLTLCLHDGGHLVPPGWAERTRAWLAATPE